MSGPRAAGLVLGFLADRCWGDPVRHHPVAWFGSAAAGLERSTYADNRRRGIVHLAVLAGGAAAAGALLGRLGRCGAVLEAATTAAATWTVLGGRTLEREALAVHALLEAGDLAGARVRLTHLVGRRTATLGETEIARAVIESVAENTSDAVTAPLVWGALAGPPGLLAYRATNTLDAMVGHRTPRYHRFGWACARADDLLNLPGARIAAVATMVARPPAAGRVWHTWRRDAGGHPSPNAGVIEAAFAAALAVRLGGINDYAGRTESRPVLGDGQPPVPGDVQRATVLARDVAWLSLAASVAVSLGRRRGRCNLVPHASWKPVGIRHSRATVTPPRR